MNRALERRVARLEVAAAPFAQIPIWCDRGDPGDYEASIEAMIATGEIAEADRSRCAPWWACDCPSGTHEAWLASLKAPQ
jgi:hypothetical protein